MDDLKATMVWLLKVAAMVSATVVSTWCLFMFGYSNPVLSGLPGWFFDVVTSDLLGVAALMASLGLGIGASTSFVARRMGNSAWVLMPILWVAASFAALVLGPQSSSGS